MVGRMMEVALMAAHDCEAVHNSRKRLIAVMATAVAVAEQ
jgi:hypothetical protein